MRSKGYLLILLLIFLFKSQSGITQELSSFRQNFFNPAVYNPAFTGINGHNQLFLTYKKQWMNIEDSPETIGLNFQLPTKGHLFFGAEFYSQEVVAVRSSSALLSFGYKLNITENQSLRFAISGGVGQNMLNLTSDELNTMDPAIISAYDNNYYLNGKFGMVYQYNRLQIGFSMPKIFDSDQFNYSEFNEVEINAIDNRIYSISYDFQLSPKFSFKPLVLYRDYKYDENQLEGAGIVYYQQKIWAGASYRNSLGIILGMNITDVISFSYDYSFSPFKTNNADLSTGSHELQLAFKFGQNKNTKKPLLTKSTEEDAHLKQPVLATNVETEKSEEVEEKQPNESDAKTKAPTENIAKTTTPSEQNAAPTPIENNDKSKDITEEPAQNTNVEMAVKEPTESKASKEKSEEIERHKHKEKVDIESPDFDNGFSQRNSYSISLSEGYYVVIGVFKYLNNAMKVAKTSMDNGHVADIGLYDKKNLYYVFVFYDKKDQELAKEVRSAFRKKEDFMTHGYYRSNKANISITTLI
ncbi:PorP/SprF family type IX secretion system membrane protein [Fulvivirga maritima]|uniref:PorP/SprF family type IX secretion system membrane protein n=1 Tax=Fulvivirga maritima TaxID=2904247 RepID=UPI001F3A1C88|nr:PorP/SprF family type IX secretion system membrane protein [Fulvivirga maritima]UII25517.1 PorP/SprF family type IX secretion system membrane protein [Fulvivirga maritima]